MNKWQEAIVKNKALIAVEERPGFYNSHIFNGNSRSYRGASTTSTSIGDWLPSILGPNTDLTPATRKTLMSRARYLVRNTMVGAASINRPTENVVGCGLFPMPKINHVALGITKEVANQKKMEILTNFNIWADNADECDLFNINTFWDLQEIIFRSALASGDAFANSPFKKRKNNLFGVKIQLVEADRVENPFGMENTERIVDGIEFDRNGAPLHYFVNKGHPGEMHRFLVSQEFQKVRAFDQITGRRRFMHLHSNDKRPGQARTPSFLACVIEASKMIDDTLTNHQISMAIQTCFTTFITKEVASTGPPFVGANTKQHQLHPDRRDIRLGPGLIIELFPGEKIENAKPEVMNVDLDKALMPLLKVYCAAIGIPIEQFLINFKTSFTSARAALNQASLLYKNKRKWLGNMFCQPFYTLLMDESVANGIITLPGYGDPMKRKLWNSCLWQGEAPAHLDELKAANAKKIRLEIKDTSPQEEIARDGRDFEQVHSEQVEAKQRRIEEGLELPIILENANVNIQNKIGQEEEESANDDLFDANDAIEEDLDNDDDSEDDSEDPEDVGGEDDE